MRDATTFGWIVLAYAGVGIAAILSNRLYRDVRRLTKRGNHFVGEQLPAECIRLQSAF